MKGRLNRRSVGRAVGGALLTVLVASITVSQMFSASPATVAGATSTRGELQGGLQRQRFLEMNLMPESAGTGGGEVRDNGPAVTVGAAPGSQHGPAWFDARDFAPVAATPAATGRLQQRLYQTEMRDTGREAADDDIRLCPRGWQDCDR